MLHRAKTLRSRGRPVGSGELLVALADDVDGPAGAALASAGVDVHEAAAGVRGLQAITPASTDDVVLSPVLARIIRSAAGYAPLGSPASSAHLLDGLLDEREAIAARVLDALGVRRRDVYAALARFSPADLERDADDAPAPVIGWSATLVLGHPREALVALVTDPAYAHVVDPRVVEARRLHTDGPRVRDEFVVEVEDERRRTVVEAVETVPGAAWVVRTVEPATRLRLVEEYAVETTGSGSSLRMSITLDLGADPVFRGMALGRRSRAAFEARARKEVQRYLAAVRGVLEGGWRPDESAQAAGPSCGAGVAGDRRAE